jgi:hypothetical protein
MEDTVLLAGFSKNVVQDPEVNSTHYTATETISLENDLNINITTYLLWVKM